jgi:propionyl-CoA carboxylase alpha chain
VPLDDGFEEGMVIPIYYDPMIAKLVTFAEDRNTAIDRMTRAIDEYQISGVTTTLGFCKFAINHEAFRSGKFDTHFVNDHFKPEYLDEVDERRERALAAFIGVTSSATSASTDVPAVEQDTVSKWRMMRK